MADELSPQVTTSIDEPPSGALREVAGVFLRLGLTAFGGPAAHIAMMRRELVQQRKWVSEQHFLDLLGATNLSPGPNSSEMTIHLGYHRAGWRGLIVAGTLFILPAMCFVLAFAWAYVEFGSTPEVAWLLYGIKPVVIAIVVQALYGLARSAFKTLPLIIVGVAVVALYIVGINEIALLFGGGATVVAIEIAQRRIRSDALAVVPALGIPAAGGLVSAAAAGFSQLTLFLTFLKIGSVLYGSGYVLLAFMRNDFVERLGWITNQQLLDAVAVGQFTPGPVFTTATFVGYLVGGFPGALVATLGIFLPSFVFVAIAGPLIPKMRRWPLLGALLDGVNVAAVGLMAAVVAVLARDAIVDWFSIVLAVAAGAVLLRTHLNSAWIVLGGGLLGIAYQAVLAAA